MFRLIEISPFSIYKIVDKYMIDIEVDVKVISKLKIKLSDPTR